MASRSITTAITLKWGTLKEWNLGNESVCCRELIERYIALGASISAMMQHDTPEQKQIICDLIDEIKGDIHLAWEDKIVTKDAAKKYVAEYGLKN